MPNHLGIIFALVALLSWGFGDFFAQKAARTVGIWKALFFNGIVGFVVLFPFIKSEVFNLDPVNLLLLATLGVVALFADLFDFEALKQGKIAIVEPLLGIELPITVGLSITLGQEQLTLTQLVLILAVFIGIILAITMHHTHLHYHKRIFEKGVILAGIGAIGMALTNFLVGVSSRQISPLMAIWFTQALLVAVCVIYFIYRGGFKTIVSDFKTLPGPIAGQSILDNVAWVAFASATTLIPISIATAVSESYIALAALLGIFINREKLRYHQIAGIIIVISSIILLSLTTSA